MLGVFTVRFGPVLTQKFNRTGKWYSLLIEPEPNREPVQTEPGLFGLGQFFSIKTTKTELIFITELLRFSHMNFIVIL